MNIHKLPLFWEFLTGDKLPHWISHPRLDQDSSWSLLSWQEMLGQDILLDMDLSGLHGICWRTSCRYQEDSLPPQHEYPEFHGEVVQYLRVFLKWHIQILRLIFKTGLNVYLFCLFDRLTLSNPLFPLFLKETKLLSSGSDT